MTEGHRKKDETSEQLLAKFKIECCKEGVYELGCCASLQNIHSQQQRAFNLVWALQKQERIKPGIAVAVIGGGISGLTTAAALVASGATVTVYERTASVLHFQHGSSRFIHPNIAKWGKQEDVDLVDRSGYPVTHLPFMNWNAGPAGLVIDELSRQWKQVERSFPDTIEVLKNRNVTTISWDATNNCVRVLADNEPPKVFKLVIVAVGYGIEKLEKSHKGSYWRNDDLSQIVLGAAEPKKLLVSGGGDGGMIDVLRLSIKDFQQDAFFKLVYEDWVKDAAQRIRVEVADKKNLASLDDWLKIWKENDHELQKRAKTFIESEIREDTTVYLNGFSQHAQILHQLFVSLLIAAGKVIHLDGELDVASVQLVSNGVQVMFDKDKSEQKEQIVDMLVRRHGTESALAQISFDNDCRIAINARKEIWRDNDLASPKTFRPHYSGDFLADEFMRSHGEREYEVGFSLWTQGDVLVLSKKLLEKLDATVESGDLENLAVTPICGNSNGKQFSLRFGKLDLVTFNGADPQTVPGVKTSWRSFLPQEYPGILFRTSSRALLERLLDDEFKYNLLRIYLADTFPEDHLDWLINFDSRVFVANLRGQSNCIEFHCAPGMYQAHTYLRFPYLQEVMKNEWRVGRVHGIGWAIQNTLKTNTEKQRGNELLVR